MLPAPVYRRNAFTLGLGQQAMLASNSERWKRCKHDTNRDNGWEFRDWAGPGMPSARRQVPFIPYRLKSESPPPRAPGCPVNAAVTARVGAAQIRSQTRDLPGAGGSPPYPETARRGVAFRPDYAAPMRTMTWCLSGASSSGMRRSSRRRPSISTHATPPPTPSGFSTSIS